MKKFKKIPNTNLEINESGYVIDEQLTLTKKELDDVIFVNEEKITIRDAIERIFKSTEE